MAVTLTVRKIGNSLGVILPQEALSALKVAEGDKIVLSEAPDGMKVNNFDPDFERQMKIAEEGMRKYRNALRELAK
jgi:putative addiction module antidote